MSAVIRKSALVGAVVGLSLLAATSGASADQISSTGNGGTAAASSNGGEAALGDVESGANVGSVIGIGDTWGDVEVSGGAIANSTNVEVGLGGGTAISDASGGGEPQD